MYIQKLTKSIFPLFGWLKAVSFDNLQGFVEWFSPRGSNSSHKKHQQSYSLGTAIKTTFSLMSGKGL